MADSQVRVESYKVILYSAVRSPQIAAACVYLDSDDFRIELLFEGHKLEGAADDFFESFCRIREQLEPMMLFPKCYAAHLQAFPSGMSRGMGGGMKLYKVKLGCAAKTADLVHMFDTDEYVIPATVAEQREFFDKWVASINRGN